MEINFKISVLLLGILCTGLTAGLCFTWTNAVTTGLEKLDDFGFLQSFQAMNRAIINPIFLIVFFSPVVLLSANAFLHRNAYPLTFWLFLLAAILFFVGIGMITIFKNVPLNELLDKAVLEHLSDIELKQLRLTFENPWRRWHLYRTLTAFVSFLLLLIGVICKH